MVTISMLVVPCCVVVCVHVLYQMRSYLLLISFANTVRDIVSQWGRWVQVLAAAQFNSCKLSSLGVDLTWALTRAVMRATGGAGGASWLLRGFVGR